jgi:hypothetical protein
MKFDFKTIKKPALYSVVLGVFAIGLICLHLNTSVFLFTSQAQYERLENRIERAVERNDWHRVLTLCNQFLKLIADDLDKGRISQDDANAGWQKIVIHTKYALILTGELLENYFFYSRYAGFNQLISDQEPDIFLMPATHHFFSGMELQALAMASSFNHFETYEDPPSLNNFIKSSIIAGDYRTPKTFINRLEKDGNRSQRRQARKYRALLADTSAINANPYYIARRELGPASDFNVNWNFDRSIAELHFHAPNNQRAFEYTMLFALLHNVSDFFQEIETLLERFDYKHIPRHLEEAILVFTDYGWNPEISRNDILAETFGGLTIRKETILRHENMVQHWIMLNNRQLNPDWFIDTYWDTYQLHFIQITGQL